MTSLVLSSCSPIENYHLIEEAVNCEINRIKAAPNYNKNEVIKQKVDEIDKALDRLYLMVVQQNSSHKASLNKRLKAEELTQINPDEALQIDLTTTRLMLNVHISIWEETSQSWDEQSLEFNEYLAGFCKKISLRDALNIARKNFFNILLTGDGTWGPIWGKTKALENVEQKLNISDN